MADDLPSLRLDQLDPVLKHRVRLAVCVLLSRSDAITFARFKQVLDQTDGNLGAQLRKLEEAGYVSLKRAFVERKPTTWYSLTARGRSALKRHLGALRTLTDGA